MLFCLFKIIAQMVCFEQKNAHFSSKCAFFMFSYTHFEEKCVTLQSFCHDRLHLNKYK